MVCDQKKEERGEVCVRISFKCRCSGVQRYQWEKALGLNKVEHEPLLVDSSLCLCGDIQG